MSNIIDEARKLKSQAMDVRDSGDFERAVRLIEKAEQNLRNALNELRSSRENTERAGRLEVEIANQLVHILGSKGGIFRREKRYGASADAYDAGYEFERPESGYGIINSYNLVQRLVSRVFIEPAAVHNEDVIVRGLSIRNELLKAKEELKRQRSGKRSDDEYAAADLALVCLLLGDDEWEVALNDFINSTPPPQPYSVRVTLEVIRDIHKALTGLPSAPKSLESRLSKADQELSLAAAGS